MQETLEIKRKCFVDFQEYLIEKLRNPEYKKGFEEELDKVTLETIINDSLRNTGHYKYCVEVMDIDDYCN